MTLLAAVLIAFALTLIALKLEDFVLWIAGHYQEWREDYAKYRDD